MEEKMLQKTAINYSKNYDEQQTSFRRALEEQILSDWQREAKNLVLDIGCGTGRSILHFIREDRFFIGIDISSSMLQIARNKFLKLNKNNLIEFVLCDAENLPFRDSTFETVTSFGAFHHLSYPFRSLKEVYRILNDHGLLFAIELNKTNLKTFTMFYAYLLPSFFQKILEKLSKKINLAKKGTSKIDYHPGHPGKRNPPNIDVF